MVMMLGSHAAMTRSSGPRLWWRGVPSEGDLEV